MADDKPCISELYESEGLDIDLVDGIAFNAELEVENIDLKQDEQGFDDICEAESEEADLLADSSAVEYGAASNKQSK